MGEFVQLIPSAMRPEATEGRVGFLHPFEMTGFEEQSRLKILLRDFTLQGLIDKAMVLKGIQKRVEAKYPETKIKVEIIQQYRNMKLVLDKYPQVTAFALQAAERAGVKPWLQPVRGGTDGAILTFKGLPSPNLFTAGENSHSKLEWVPEKGMQLTVNMLVELVQLWVEKGAHVKNKAKK